MSSEQQATAALRIADVLRNAANEAIDELEYHRADEHASRIIAIVREALLSESEVGLRSLWSGDKLADSQRSAYKGSLEEVLYTAFPDTAE